MKVISLFNQAGGQGKTMLTMNLGFHLAQRGKRVLLIDMDGQASLTRLAGVSKPKNLSRSIYDAVLEKKDLPILQDIHGMDWVPANSRLYTLDLQLALEDQPGSYLRELLETIEEDYDFVLIDCPPSLDMKSVNSLIASTHFLVPIETADKGLQGMDELLETVNQVIQLGNPDILSAGIIPNHYSSQETICRFYLEQIESWFGQLKVYTPIPRRTDFKHAWTHKMPLKKVNPKSDALPIFESICDNLETL